MYRHVYTDATKLTPEFIKRKHQLTQPGPDLPCCILLQGLRPPQTETIFLPGSRAVNSSDGGGEQAPPKSKAEMEALAELPGVQVKRFPATLGLHEERLRSQKLVCLFRRPTNNSFSGL